MKLWSDIALQAPMWLLLLEIIPVIIIYRYQRRKLMGVVAMDIPTLSDLPASPRSVAAKWLEPLFWIAISLLIIALARPQREFAEEIVKWEGIDILLVMDLSSSMLARDFDPDRLTVSKQGSGISTTSCG